MNSCNSTVRPQLCQTNPMMERAAGCWQAICIPFGEITKFIFFMSWTSPGKELGGLQTLVMLGQLPPLQQDRKKMYFSPCPGVGSWGLGVQSGKWEGWKRVGRVGKEPYRCQPWGLASRSSCMSQSCMHPAVLTAHLIFLDGVALNGY